MRPLKTIAMVQMGISFRARIEPDQDGSIAVIQMRDLTEIHALNHPRLTIIDRKGINERHFVKCKDLVFRSRGKTTTVIIHSAMEQTIVAAPLLRIRVTSKDVLPEYLCWFINQPSSQAFLHRRATGTAMMMIGKSILNTLEVPLPCLAQQKKIVTLAKLSDKEQALMADLARHRQQLVNGMLMKLIAESKQILNPTSTRA